MSMADTSPYVELLSVMARLRAPEGCPWDREQTHESLRTYLLEEAYEALEAIDQSNPEELCKELGDVLLQIVFHAQIAAEAGSFTMADVCQSIVNKLVHRHPHVFGDVEVDGSEQVLTNWEELKRQEKGHSETPHSVLDGIPAQLPSLLRAQRVQSRASRVGFDWEDVSGPLDKVEEEFAELRAEWEEGNASAAEEEMGDLLFALVNSARFLKIDAEDALRRAVDKFGRRFRKVESVLEQQSRSLADASLEEMDAIWDRVKAEE
jgi:tetrapyrrole methylase family protein / MazG family protein